MIETGYQARLCRFSEPRRADRFADYRRSLHAQRAERGDQKTIDTPVRFVKVACGVDRCGDRVGDLSIVENGAPTRGATHDVDPALGEAPEIVAATRRLVPS